MTAFSLTTLRARVREKADMPSTQFVTDTANSLDAFINEGIQKLHDKLIEAYDSDYVEKSQAFTYVANQDVSLPTDFYKLLGVDLNYGAGVVTLNKYNRRERNSYKNINALGLFGPMPSYKLTSVGGLAGTGALRFLPQPAAGSTGVIWYSPQATVLVAGGDTVNVPGGWERYIVAYAAMCCLDKEESDSSQQMKLLADMDQEFKAIINNRDASQPTQSVDVDNVNNPILWW
jgi:hypothetical protein